jgi:hypothetical protein
MPQTCEQWLSGGDADDEAEDQPAAPPQANKRQRAAKDAGLAGPPAAGASGSNSRLHGEEAVRSKPVTYRKRLRRSDLETITGADDIIYEGEGRLMLGGRAGGYSGTRAAAASRRG